MLKLLKKLKICQKCFGVHSLQLFAANTRLFQVKKLLSQKMVTTSDVAQFIRTNSDTSIGHKN